MGGQKRFASRPKCDPLAVAPRTAVRHHQKSILDAEVCLMTCSVPSLIAGDSLQPWLGEEVLSLSFTLPCSDYPAAVILWRFMKWWKQKETGRMLMRTVSRRSWDLSESHTITRPLHPLLS